MTILRALILGGGSCVWDDVAAVELMIGHPWDGIVIAANDVGCHWPRPLDHWCSLHSNKMDGWIKQRSANGFPPCGTTWSRGGAAHRAMRQITPWAGGSSGMMAVAIAAELGVTHAILCGIPMTVTPHFQESTVHQATSPWTQAKAHWVPWPKFAPRMGFVRSMSGRTRELLGAPDRDWLAQPSSTMNAPAMDPAPAPARSVATVKRRPIRRPSMKTLCNDHGDRYKARDCYGCHIASNNAITALCQQLQPRMHTAPLDQIKRIATGLERARLGVLRMTPELHAAKDLLALPLLPIAPPIDPATESTPLPESIDHAHSDDPERPNDETGTPSTDHGDGDATPAERDAERGIGASHGDAGLPADPVGGNGRSE